MGICRERETQDLPDVEFQVLSLNSGINIPSVNGKTGSREEIMPIRRKHELRPRLGLLERANQSACRAVPKSKRIVLTRRNYLSAIRRKGKPIYMVVPNLRDEPRPFNTL